MRRKTGMDAICSSFFFFSSSSSTSFLSPIYDIFYMLSAFFHSFMVREAPPGLNIRQGLCLLCSFLSFLSSFLFC